MNKDKARELAKGYLLRNALNKITEAANNGLWEVKIIFNTTTYKRSDLEELRNQLWDLGFGGHLVKEPGYKCVLTIFWV